MLIAWFQLLGRMDELNYSATVTRRLNKNERIAAIQLENLILTLNGRLDKIGVIQGLHQQQW